MLNPYSVEMSMYDEQNNGNLPTKLSPMAFFENVKHRSMIDYILRSELQLNM